MTPANRISQTFKQSARLASRTGRLLLCLTFILTPKLAIAQTPVSSTNPATNPQHAKTCRQQLIQIHRAIQRFQTKYQRRPHWLSELIVEGVIGESMLICPIVQQTGDPIATRENLQDDVFNDPHAYYAPSYAYEFCNAIIPLWPGIQITYADYKLAQRQVDGIGDRVPIVRCMSHEKVINLALDGSLYESDSDWEEVFHRGPDKSDAHAKHRQENLFADQKPFILASRLPKRSPAAPPHLIDLSKNYNAYLDKFWLQWQQTADLTALLYHSQNSDGLVMLGPDKIPFDARGLIQLDAKYVLGPFPEAVAISSVQGTLSRLHILHATAERGDYDTELPNELVAIYQIHFADGSIARREIVSGRDIGRWIFDPNSFGPKDARPVWVAPENANLHAKGLRKRCGLFLTTWDNPSPQKEVVRFSIQSPQNDEGELRNVLGVFVVAITVAP